MASTVQMAKRAEARNQAVQDHLESLDARLAKMEKWLLAIGRSLKVNVVDGEEESPPSAKSSGKGPKGAVTTDGPSDG